MNNYKRTHNVVKVALLSWAIVLLPAIGNAISVDEIIKRVVDNLNGETAEMEITMIVKTSRTERTMRMKSYSIGQEKSFIKVLYPRKDKGITFLKVDNSMWQYVPRIEKVIKIPASMMLQSWMGSDFSNDDLVKESSLDEDYTHELIEETEEAYLVNMQPKLEAAVVWGKIHMSISKEHYLPVDVSYFDEEGNLVRVLEYKEVKPYGERFYPSVWVMTPKSAGKAGHETRIIVSAALFDSKVDEGYFTKRALKRYSK